MNRRGGGSLLGRWNASQASGTGSAAEHGRQAGCRQKQPPRPPHLMSCVSSGVSSGASSSLTASTAASAAAAALLELGSGSWLYTRSSGCRGACMPGACGGGEEAGSGVGGPCAMLLLISQQGGAAGAESPPASAPLSVLPLAAAALPPPPPQWPAAASDLPARCEANRPCPSCCSACRRGPQARKADGWRLESGRGGARELGSGCRSSAGSTRCNGECRRTGEGAWQQRRAAAAAGRKAVTAWASAEHSVVAWHTATVSCSIGACAGAILAARDALRSPSPP